MASRLDHLLERMPVPPPATVARRRRTVSIALTVSVALLALHLGCEDSQNKKASGSPASPYAETTASSQSTTTPSSGPALSSFVTRDTEGNLHWPRPRSTERQGERDEMVDRQIARSGLFRGSVNDGRVLAAMRAVPRHEFVPRNQQRSAYDDTPLPIGNGQTISQPYIVAMMTELLEVKPGDRILEIGTGSGYQAAVLTELTPYVYTIEIVEPLYREAVERFERLGYKTIQTRLGDGYQGWPEHAPFDGIIVTCSAEDVPPPLWEQLKEGGRMVIPVGGVSETQRLIVLTKEKGGGRKSRTVLPVLFVPMTGENQKP